MALTVQSQMIIFLVGVALTSLWQHADAHGRLLTPPARGSMWRRGFKTPKNYQDNELFCGGFQHQVQQGYKCGVCGDPYDGPRLHEPPGLYATGTIAATYPQGATVTLEVQITANHKGWFEFKLCPTNNPSVNATQGCLDQHVLQLAKQAGTRLMVEQYGSNTVQILVHLPAGLTCDFCVLQWRYHTGNSWGVDKATGKGCIGCGYQEEFYGCADIRIVAFDTSGSPANPPDNGTVGSPSNATTTVIPPSTVTTTTTTTPPSTNTVTDVSNPQAPLIKSCWSLFAVRALTDWCNLNCNSNNCPPTLCGCRDVPEPRFNTGLKPGCYATTPFMNRFGMDAWCANNCQLGFCPANICFCTKFHVFRR